jgi:hypothetical protein
VNADSSVSRGSAAPVRASLPIWRRVVPIVVAVALIGYVVSGIDWDSYWFHLLAVNYATFLGSMVLLVAAMLFADAFATRAVYRVTIADVSWRSLVVVRGASYLPAILNHHVGQAWTTYLLSRVYGVPFWRVAGATLLVYASWAGCLLILGGAAVWIAGYPIAWLLLPLGSGVAYLVLLYVRPKRLASMTMLAPLFEAGIRGHLVALALRMPHTLICFLLTWVPFWFFDVRIPLAAAATYIPIIMVVVTLPLSPLGWGTRDVLAATFFERFVAAATHEQRLAQLAASTTATAVTLTVLSALVGLIFMRPASRLLRGDDPEAPPT